MMSEQSSDVKPSGKSGKVLVVILVVALVLLLGAIATIFVREGNLKQTNARLMVAYAQLDSIGEEMDSKIVQIEQLGGNVEELTAVRDSLEREKEGLLEARVRSSKQIATLRNRVEGYRELLVLKDVEISELKKVNQELVVENTELKTERNKLNQTIQAAQQKEAALTEKVQIASRLAAENIAVVALNARGKAREDEFRARQVSKLQVTFNIAKNDVAPVAGKDILMRIKDENDNVLFDVARGSGTFELDGKETFYTAKQEILFDNSRQEVRFLYEKGSEYLPGAYIMELYTDGYLMGSKSFKVK
jgi:flagellar basal body-associated protein FliL